MLKKISLVGKDKYARDETANEVHLMAELSSPFVVRYHDCFVEENSLHVVMEYCSEGDLSQLLRHEGPLDEPTVRRFAAHILLGLAHLHERGVVHRDIKGANILLGGQAEVPGARVLKLADFGASRRLTTAAVAAAAAAAAASGKREDGASYCGTVLWMAPEVIRSFGNGASGGSVGIHWERADVWSVGCTVVEMVTAQSPWALCNGGAGFGTSVVALEHIATTTSRPPVPDSLGGACLGLLYRCFQRDPRRRPDVADLLLDPFVAASVRSERRQHCHSASRRESGPRRGEPAAGGILADDCGIPSNHEGPPRERLLASGSRRIGLQPRVPVLDFSKLARDSDCAAPLYKDGVNVAKRIAAGKYVKKKSRSRAQHAFLSALTQGSRSPRSPSNSSLSSLASQTSDAEGTPGLRRNRAREPDAADILATAGWRPTQRAQGSNGNVKGRGHTGGSSRMPAVLPSAEVFAWPVKARGAGGRATGSTRAFASVRCIRPGRDGKRLFSPPLQQHGDRSLVAPERCRLNGGTTIDHDEDTLSVASAFSSASAPIGDRWFKRDGDSGRPHSARLVFDFGNGDWRRDSGSGRRSAPPSAVHLFDGDLGSEDAAYKLSQNMGLGGSSSVVSSAPIGAMLGISGLMQMSRSAPVSPATSRTNSRAASPVSQCESGSIPIDVDEETSAKSGSDLRTGPSLRRTRSSGSLGVARVSRHRAKQPRRRSSRTPSPRNLDPLPHRGAMPLSAARLFVSPASLSQHVTFPPESPPSDEKMRRGARPTTADRRPGARRRSGLPPVQCTDGGEWRTRGRHGARDSGKEDPGEGGRARSSREGKPHRKKHRRRGKRSNRRKRTALVPARGADAVGNPSPVPNSAATEGGVSHLEGGSVDAPSTPAFPPNVEVSETARHILLWWVQTARRHRAEQHARQQRWWQNWWRHRAWTDAYSEAYWHYYWHYYAHYHGDDGNVPYYRELSSQAAPQSSSDNNGGGAKGDHARLEWGVHDWESHWDDEKAVQYYFSPTCFDPR